LIKELIDKHDIKMIELETDKEAVFFYEKLGFNIESLGEKYPGVKRYKCTWIRELIEVESKKF
jgi:ribosomal protein S18 acetylase RimI-like enzyme